MLAGSFVVLPFLGPEHFLTQMNGVETGIWPVWRSLNDSEHIWYLYEATCLITWGFDETIFHRFDVVNCPRWSKHPKEMTKH